MIGLEERLAEITERQVNMLGNLELRANTATLHVHPDGTGADGLSWRTAYPTLNAALDAAGAGENDLTLILIAPGTYDINTTGQPTWTANVVLQGTHRDYTVITNTHASASCVLRLEGLVVIRDLGITHVAADNGLVVTQSGLRVYRSRFDGSALTGAGISLALFGDSSCCAKVIDCDFLGNTTHTIGIKVDDFAYSHFERLRMHEFERCVWIQGSTAADHNLFAWCDMGDSALAFDIDEGNEQFLYEIIFHHNTRNIDDEVGDHVFGNIHGAFPIYILPDDFNGVTVNTGAANTYGGDTQLIAAAAIDNPFRVVGAHFEPSSAEWYKTRFSGDSGATHYDEIQFDATKREGSAFPSGTEFIFNKGTRISCSAKDVSGGDNVKVWVEIQEI